VFPKYSTAVFYFEIKNPVLIIPGVLGTELVETDRLIWLNTLKLIDPIDSFLEPLAFTDDLLSKSSDVRPTNVLSAVPGIYNYTPLSKLTTT
jgi:hypothetical protein